MKIKIGDNTYRASQLEKCLMALVKNTEICHVDIGLGVDGIMATVYFGDESPAFSEGCVSMFSALCDALKTAKDEYPFYLQNVEVIES